MTDPAKPLVDEAPLSEDVSMLLYAFNEGLQERVYEAAFDPPTVYKLIEEALETGARSQRGDYSPMKLPDEGWKPAKPPVVREWDDSFLIERGACDEHNAAIQYLQAELRSRPTQEEFEATQTEMRVQYERAERIWRKLNAKLAVSEAERERLKEIVRLYVDHMDVRPEHSGFVALAGKDPTDGQS